VVEKKRVAEKGVAIGRFKERSGMDGWRKVPRMRDGRRNGRRLPPLRAPEALEPRRLLTSGYLPLNLVSDQAATALIQDANLVNPWGLALNANGGDVWVTDRGSGVASLYSGAVGGSPFQAYPLVVGIPGGSATGIAANGSTSFVVHSGQSSGPASFLFASAGGQIAGWNQGVPPSSPATLAQTAASTVGAIYAGLAVANNGGQNFLYAADFHDNRIDVFDATFQSITPSGGFSDAGLPEGFAPYNIVNTGSSLLVSYAMQDAGAQNAVAGPGNGFIDVFDFNGTLQKELVTGQPGNGASPLNAPWGMAVAPATFGDYGGALLVANNGDGSIDAFNLQTGSPLGTMTLASGAPLTIDGLRGLSFGNGLTVGNSNELFYSAGTDGGLHGLFGAIQNAQGVAIAAQGTSIAATAGMNFNGTLAVFNDAQNMSPGSFTANIDWGDGTNTPGGVTTLAGGGFALSGSHTYLPGGIKSITIQIRDSLGKTATANSVAQVVVPGLAMTGLTIATTEAATFSGAVATFTDGDGNTSTFPYTATILWGDGATSTGTVSFNAGKFSVLGAHSYAEEGTTAVSVSVSDLDGPTASVLGAARIADAPLTGLNRTLAITETAAFSGAVGTFTDANPNSTADEFTATIDWGDGSVTPGTVSLAVGGTFSVLGAHTYADEGSLPVRVTVNDAGGSSATILSLANIAEGDVLSAEILPIAALEGVLFNGAVASLSNLNLLSPATDFSAAIDWGDGTTTDGTLVGAAGVFTINGQHTYADEGDYLVRVLAADDGGAAAASAQATITIADNDVLAVTGVTIQPTEGLAFSGAVATVSDTIAASPDEFTATIDWGDGNLGAATLSGAEGQFTISGSHTYARFGTYLAVVSISDNAPGTASAVATLTTVVDDAPLTCAGVTIQNTEGQAFSGMVATISDANPLGLLSDLSATIDWGDGTVSAGVLSALGGFNVVGSHVYEVGGTYQAAIVINDVGGGVSTAISTAISTFLVADYPLVALASPVAGTEGATFSGAVSTFVDTDPDGGTLADFTASITWGDGTSSAGTITGSAGNYVVLGTHVFRDETDSILVVINDVGGASATVTVAASVADADVFTPGGMTLAATEGQSLSGALAHFTDSYAGADANGLTAAVDWGDGTQTSATVSGSAGSFTVTGSHVYAQTGQFTAQVSLADDAPGTASATAATTIDVADAPLTATGVTLSAAEGNRFTGAVATFDDGNLLSSAADFMATIDWGDGTSSTAGTVALVAAGSFFVTGDHTYAETGDGLAVKVIIHDLGGSLATVVSTANIVDAALTASAVTIAATEGLSFSGTVATFTDGNPSATTADFTATIDWGDGSSVTEGTLRAVAGGFLVSGSHTYADESTNLPMRVTISDRDGSMAIAASTANIGDAALTAGDITFAATEGVTFNGVVATFSDANPSAPIADFSATIDWGDGASTSSGTIDTSGGAFVVKGAHVYAEKATRQVTVAIHDVGGSHATATSTASVADAPLTPGALLTIAATEGALFSGTVGTFTDGNAFATKADFTATIDWGDAATTTGIILTAPGGVFLVSGSHTYAEPAAGLPIQITVADIDGSQALVLSSAHVTSTHFTASGATLATIEGTTFTGTVATCNDTDLNASHYAATVDWGDGTTTAATITAAPGGGFLIAAKHVFGSAGASQITTVVTNPALDKLTVTSRANVADAPLHANGVTLAATEGIAFNGLVASFGDEDLGGRVANYTATIDWGDGFGSAGQVTAAGGGTFAVIGSHIYTEETQGLAVSVAIRDIGGAQVTAASTANVDDAPLDLTPAKVQVPPGGSASNLVLATFTDLGGAEPLSSYAATIDWGDSTTTTVGSLRPAGAMFQIAGSHHYAAPGTYNIQLLLRDEGGSSATATATADVQPTANQLYVAAAYQDVVARPVDTPALISRAQQLDAGQDRSVLADFLDHSAEYFGNIIITPAYERYLGRAPDSGGLVFWIDQMQNHALTDERLGSGFIGSPEFYAHAGGTDKSWIDAMYEDLLGRPADAAGESYWLAQLSSGANRADVAYGFAASRERESQRITDDYMHYLGRQPDDQGINFWVDQFAAGMTNENVITGFVASDEYFQKHTRE
jgi:uncharacterized protein (TIGR03118 family)